MSEQRNAERDREIIEAAIANPYEFIAKYGDIILHWMDRAEKWRKEALQQYPTPDAYEAACAALEKHRDRANTCEAEVYKWREKALQQEQRVAELEQQVRELEDNEPKRQRFRMDLNGNLTPIESEDRGE